MRLLLRLPSQDALIDLLDRPTIVSSQPGRGSPDTRQEAFAFDAPLDDTIIRDAARDHHEEERERSYAACRAFTAYMRSILDCDKYTAAIVRDEDDLELSLSLIHI